MRALLWKLARALLFRLDAETAHRATVVLVRLLGAFGGAPLRIVSGAPRRPLPSGEAEVMGLRFGSRVGLAAGFDKDAELLPWLPALGFGFAEVGTVTPRPQPGNDRPRLFRAPAEGALFNRMGFNGLGAAVVSRRLEHARERLPEWFRVGVNVGKNKDTPLEDAARDYRLATAAFEGLADFLVINVSSPNTPGLRSLQEVEALKPIVEGVAGAIAGWRKRPPLLLKLAPELRGERLAAVLQAGRAWGIDAWVLTNTLAGEYRGAGTALPGGWSGAPLAERARESLREARALTDRPLISVGGILSAGEALERRRLGADLVQLYSGWVLGGPSFPAEVARALRDRGGRD